MVEHQLPKLRMRVRFPSPAPFRRQLLLPLALLIAVTCLPALAWPQAAPADDISTRPNAGGTADVVTVRFGLIDIVGIEDRRQQFSIDAFVEVHWDDPRLADEAVAASRHRTLPRDAIWTPRLAVLNGRGLERQLPDVVTVDREGHVVLRQRLVGPVAADLKLQEFPFDTQALTIDVVSYQYAPDELVFSTDSEIIAKPETFRSKGWRFDVLEPEFSVYRLSEDGTGTSLLRYTVRAERKSVYYALTLALPMTLILFLAWLVHWLPPSVIPPRVGMSSATVFSLIAFGVSFRLTLPAIDYLTRADRFAVLSTMLVAVSLAVTILASSWATHDRIEEANRLSRHTRIAFPLAYVLIILVTVIV